MRYYLRHVSIATAFAALLGAAAAYAAPPVPGSGAAAPVLHVAESDYRRHIEALASDAF